MKDYNGLLERLREVVGMPSLMEINYPPSELCAPTCGECGGVVVVVVDG